MFCLEPGRDGEGKGIEGDPYERLKSNLDAAYRGNRAPIPFYIHSFWFNGVSLQLSLYNFYIFLLETSCCCIRMSFEVAPRVANIQVCSW